MAERKEGLPRVAVPHRGSPSVSRAVAILNLIASRPGGWSLTQIASSLGLAKSSTLVIMTSLEAAGFVGRTDNNYELDAGVLTPAAGFLNSVDIVNLFKRRMLTSTVLSGEIGHLALLVGHDVTYVARHIGRPPLPVTGSVGDRFPASITAVGAALLAQKTDEEIAELYSDPEMFICWTPRSTSTLDQLLAKLRQTREQGYSIDDGETHPNVFAYGLVVRRKGNYILDLSMSVSLRRENSDTGHRRAALDQLKGVRDALESGIDLL